MDKLANYEIPFVGLKNGKHTFDFEVGSSFFECFETYQEFSFPRLSVQVLLHKHSTFLEFSFDLKGVLELQCDITGEGFDYLVEQKMDLLVKFGERFEDTDVQLVTIPHTEHSFNVAQMIYEMTMLSVPMKKISPNVSPNDMALIEKYMLKEEVGEEENDEIDPRWNVLKDLK